MNNGEVPLDPTQARERLQGERERIEHSLAEREQLLEGELEEIDADADLLDGGELIEEEEVDDAILEQLQTELAAVERAEKRLAEGTYGLSVQSGEPISPERLETIPWAERTAQEEEDYERTNRRAP
ncbi:MAG: hypothetical protein WB507_14545 [Solirubrobacterales bacterium]